MKATRLVITAHDLELGVPRRRFGHRLRDLGDRLRLRGGIERELDSEETPDGRPGIAVLHVRDVRQGAGQAGRAARRPVGADLPDHRGVCRARRGRAAPSLGKTLRFFGDGWQISKVIDGVRYWRVPVMDGEFVAQETRPWSRSVGRRQPAATGARPREQALAACEQRGRGHARGARGRSCRSRAAWCARARRSGSKYKFMKASTNDAYCPTLEGPGARHRRWPRDRLGAGDSRRRRWIEEAIRESMRAGIEAVCRFGPQKGIYRISAGNYGGKLGPYHFHLRQILA